ncbi:RxLR effector protein [Phytophthora megakarya]|uniref:RxLR effector protein n=1 Tax=Phytophthora megakarya TaxID=4795 RepID=A0A225ULR1_9STRA|nr:RxLR effector protein [Phytophthora megakarya]
MRFISLWIMLVTAFAINLRFIGAEQTISNNIKRIPTADTVPDTEQKVQRLRRNEKTASEERYIAVPPYAAYVNMMRRTRTSTQSSEVLQKAKNHQPLPNGRRFSSLYLALA